jgi:hypothetical protein
MIILIIKGQSEEVASIEDPAIAGENTGSLL